MTPEQELHLKKILEMTAVNLELKYRRGQQEHGGNLFDLSTRELLENAIEEAIDQVVYLLTLKHKLYP